MRFSFIVVLLVLLGLLPARAQEPARIYAAASLTGALTEIAEHWHRQGNPRPVLVFGASSTLAKQIANGAPADLFASADRKWMDYLAQRRRIDAGTRKERLGNALVLIAPRGREITVTMDPSFRLSSAFSGKMCTGEPDVVPVGTYAKQALSALGWWSSIASRVVGTDDVRTALAFVERGECPLGVVYATDAAMSRKVTAIGTFPPGSHEPIVYPFALVAGGAREQARAFLAYLDAPMASDVFGRHGFVQLAR